MEKIYNVTGKRYDKLPCKEECIIEELRDLKLEKELSLLNRFKTFFKNLF